jgi:hypothetical protein
MSNEMKQASPSHPERGLAPESQLLTKGNEMETGIFTEVKEASIKNISLKSDGQRINAWLTKQVENPVTGRTSSILNIAITSTRPEVITQLSALGDGSHFVTILGEIRDNNYDNAKGDRVYGKQIVVDEVMVLA